MTSHTKQFILAGRLSTRPSWCCRNEPTDTRRQSSKQAGWRHAGAVERSGLERVAGADGASPSWARQRPLSSSGTDSVYRTISMSPIHRCRTRSMAFANPSRCVTRQATTNATKGLRMAYTDAVGIRVRNSNVLRARKSGQGSACGRCQKITTDACPHATLSTSCQYRCFEEFRPADGGAIPMSGSKKITSAVRRAANARLKYASRGTATVGRVSEKNVAPGSSASEAASNSCMARWLLCTRFCRKSKSSDDQGTGTCGAWRGNRYARPGRCCRRGSSSSKRPLGVLPHKYTGASRICDNR